MYFEHAPAIWAAVPSLVPGGLLVEGGGPDAAVAGRLAPLFDRARARLAGAGESDLPEVQAWRRAFSQMGLKPTQYRSAAEALLRRTVELEPRLGAARMHLASVLVQRGAHRTKRVGIGFARLRVQTQLGKLRHGAGFGGSGLRGQRR